MRINLIIGLNRGILSRCIITILSIGTAGLVQIVHIEKSPS